MPDDVKPSGRRGAGTGSGHAATASRPELSRDGADDAFRQLIYNLLTISRSLQEVRDGVAALMGVSGPQYSILMAVSELAGRDGVGVKRIADHLHVSGAFVTAETNKLVDAGYLRKRQDAADQRRVRLVVAPAGRRAIDRVLPDLVRINDTFFGGLGRADYRTLCDITASMIPHADAAVGLIRERGDG